jgi:general secretion pathway protein J
MLTKNKTTGFTLIELIIAMAVFSVMAVIAYTGLATVLDNHENLSSQREYQRNLVLAFMRIEDDLDHIRARGIRDISGDPLAAFIGHPPGSRSVTEPALEFTRGGSPIIVSATPQSDLQRIAYKLDDEGRLSRLSWPALDRSPTTQAREHVLLTDIKEMEIRYFKADKKWSDSWPPLGNENKNEVLPRGLELKIKIGEIELTRLFLVHG